MNAYRRAERGNTDFRSANQYSRPQPITLNTQKWYNMQQIDMSGNLPMRRRAGNAKVRYSAAYPTGRERIAKGLLYHGVPIVFKLIRRMTYERTE